MSEEVLVSFPSAHIELMSRPADILGRLRPRKVINRDEKSGTTEMPLCEIWHAFRAIEFQHQWDSLKFYSRSWFGFAHPPCTILPRHAGFDKRPVSFGKSHLYDDGSTALYPKIMPSDAQSVLIVGASDIVPNDAMYEGIATAFSLHVVLPGGPPNVRAHTFHFSTKTVDELEKEFTEIANAKMAPEKAREQILGIFYEQRCANYAL